MITSFADFARSAGSEVVLCPRNIDFDTPARICAEHTAFERSPTHIHTHTRTRTHSNTHTHIHIHIHIQSVLSAAGPKARSEVSFLLARTRETTHLGNGPKARTNLPAPAPRPARGCHIDFDRPA